MNPHFKYGLYTWGCASKSYIKKLLTHQKPKMLIVENFKTKDSCRNTFKTLLIPSLYISETYLFKKT